MTADSKDEAAARAKREAQNDIIRLREEIASTVDAIEWKLDVPRQARDLRDRLREKLRDGANRAKTGAGDAQTRAKRFAEEDPVLLGVIGAAAVALVSGLTWAAVAASRR